MDLKCTFIYLLDIPDAEFNSAQCPFCTTTIAAATTTTTTTTTAANNNSNNNNNNNRDNMRLNVTVRRVRLTTVAVQK